MDVKFDRMNEKVERTCFIGELKNVIKILIDLCIKKYLHHIYPSTMSMSHVDIMEKIPPILEKYIKV